MENTKSNSKKPSGIGISMSTFCVSNGPSTSEKINENKEKEEKEEKQEMKDFFSKINDMIENQIAILEEALTDPKTDDKKKLKEQIKNYTKEDGLDLLNQIFDQIKIIIRDDSHSRFSIGFIFNRIKKFLKESS